MKEMRATFHTLKGVAPLKLMILQLLHCWQVPFHTLKGVAPLKHLHALANLLRDCGPSTPSKVWLR